MRALLIGDEEKTAILAAVERARAKPIPWATLRGVIGGENTPGFLGLADRVPDHERPPSEQVDIPIGYRFCVSYEEQPAGVLAHFSISVNAPNKLPHETAARMILAAAGFNLDKADNAWVEEFLINGKPGGLAINLLFLIAPAEVGHA
jgi:hypothetical protein